MARSGEYLDLTGLKFGTLLVESFSHQDFEDGGKAWFWCKCDCGRITCVRGGLLKSQTRTCKWCARYVRSKRRKNPKHPKRAKRFGSPAS